MLFSRPCMFKLSICDQTAL